MITVVVVSSISDEQYGPILCQELSKLLSSASIISTTLRGEQCCCTPFRDEEAEASKPVVELGFAQMSLFQNLDFSATL